MPKCMLPELRRSRNFRLPDQGRIQATGVSNGTSDLVRIALFVVADILSHPPRDQHLEQSPEVAEGPQDTEVTEGSA